MAARRGLEGTRLHSTSVYGSIGACETSDQWPAAYSVREVLRKFLVRLSFCADLVAIPVGQRVMKDRPPLKIRRLAALHNANLFLLSLYMSIETYRQVTRRDLRNAFGLDDLRHV